MSVEPEVIEKRDVKESLLFECAWEVANKGQLFSLRLFKRIFAVLFLYLDVDDVLLFSHDNTQLAVSTRS